MGDLTGINDQRLRENKTFVSLSLDDFPVVFLMADIVKCEFLVLAQEYVMSLLYHLIFGQIDILFLQVILVHKSMIEVFRRILCGFLTDVWLVLKIYTFLDYVTFYLDVSDEVVDLGRACTVNRRVF